MWSVSRASQISCITLSRCSLSVIVIIILSCLCLCLYVDQIMSHYHSDQRSQVSGAALWGCSLNVFVFLLVRLCLLITLITCLKGHKSLRVLYGSVFKSVYWSVWGQLKHRKSAKLPWHHNMKLSFWSLSFFGVFVPTSLWTHVWMVSSLKSHLLCIDSKVAVTDWLSDQG